MFLKRVLSLGGRFFGIMIAYVSIFPLPQLVEYVAPPSPTAVIS